jgi:L-alanine-DL-glutamate epimerase-like enolase superfamily enzyme
MYIAKAGGMAAARRVAAVAMARGLPCNVNGSLESGVGMLPTCICPGDACGDARLTADTR